MTISSDGKTIGSLRAVVCRLSPVVLTCGLVVLVACGCSKTAGEMDEEERGRPKMVEAESRKHEGRADDAVRLYRQALDADPQAARAHLDLAILLHDRKQDAEDYVRAIYHYRRYLELRPETEKKKIIEDRILKAKQRFAAVAQPLIKHPNGGEAVVLDSGQMEKKDKQIKGLEKSNAGLQRAAKDQQRMQMDLERKNVALAQANAALSKQIAVLKRSRRAVLRTYKVKQGDSLRAIASDIYGDAAMADDIYKANRETVADQNNLRPGQILKLP